MDQDYRVEYDWYGTWNVYNGYKALVEPSEEHLRQREPEEQQRQEEEANRPTTEIELLKQQLLETQQFIIDLEYQKLLENGGM